MNASSQPTRTTTEAYDLWHEQYDVDETVDAPWHLMVRSRLRPDIDLAGKRILEIGCGRGGFAIWLAKHASTPSEIVAADFSPLAVEKGKRFSEKLGLSQIRWEVRDIQQLGGHGNEFDTIFSFETIEHVPNPPMAVAELGRVLKPGGRLYLTTPNYMSIMGCYRLYCETIGKRWDEGGQPICHWTTLSKTQRWVRMAGLRILEKNAVGQYLPFPGRPAIRLLWAENIPFLSRSSGFHSLVVADKPNTRFP